VFEVNLCSEALSQDTKQPIRSWNQT